MLTLKDNLSKRKKMAGTTSLKGKKWLVPEWSRLVRSLYICNGKK